MVKEIFAVYIVKTLKIDEISPKIDLNDPYIQIATLHAL